MGMFDWQEKSADVLAQGGVIGPHERLPWPQTAMMGVQHVIAMFGATVLAPILMGFDPNVAILMSGIGTLIFFIITGGKVPSYLGSSFAFIGVVIAATAYAGKGPNANIGVALGGIIACDLVYTLIGAIVQMAGTGWIERFMPPVVTGSVVAVIGLNLAGIPIKNMAASNFDSWMQAVTFVCVGLVAVLTRGMVQRLLILVGLIVASIIYAVLTNGLGLGKPMDLTILTNAGGPGVLATDALITAGGELSALTEQTIEELDAVLPPQWSHSNPIDILGDASPERYARAVEIAAKDEASDGLLVVLTPQAMTDPTQTAELLRPYAQGAGKPLLASWMGGADIMAGESILNHAGIPTFPFPDSGTLAFNYMWQYSYNLRGIYETPTAAHGGDDPANEREAADLIDRIRRSGRTILTEHESKQLMGIYGIPTVETRLADSPEAAVAAAEAIGYPVVLKLHSETITHKTDVGGVRLDLQNADGVRSAFDAIRLGAEAAGGAEAFLGVTVQPMVRREGYEIILGSSIDPQFGPVLLFGSGGQLVEVYKDRALSLPPLTTTLARRAMEQTRIYRALRGVRGRKPVDLEALEQLMVRFSYLAVEQRWIKEIDINPLLASPEGLIALDARVVLFDRDTTEDELPKLAIRPYPTRYVANWAFADGQEITIRPIRPDDEPLVVEFHESLSEQSVHLRYFHAMKLSQRTAHDRMIRICFNDYDREIALVAERTDPDSGARSILGVARLSQLYGTRDAEFSMLINDRWHHKGLGTELLRRLIQVGRDENVERIKADILGENYVMQHVCEKVGFTLTRGADGMVEAELIL